MPRLVAPLLLAAVLVGCGPGGSDRGGSPSAVANGRSTVPPAHWVLRRDVVIGSALGADALEGIRALAVDDSDRVYVGQSPDGQIRVYSRTGKRVGTIGRLGSGPGEMRSVDCITVIRGRILVSDYRLARIEGFTIAGRFVSDAPITMPSRPGQILPLLPPIAVFADGSFLTTVTPMPGGPTVSLTPLLRVTPQGAIIDTVGAMNWRHKRMSATVQGMTFNDERPLNSGTRVAISSNGLVLVTADAAVGGAIVRVHRVALGDSPTWTRSYGLGAPRVSRELADKLIDDFQQRFAMAWKHMTGTARHLPRSVVEKAMALPSRIPPVTNVVVGTDGHIWLEHTLSNGSARLYALDAHGEIAANVAEPPDFKPMAATADELWGVRLDRDGVSLVVGYQIVKPVGPGST